MLDSKDSPQARPLAPELRRSQSADELAVVDYDMFAQPRGPAHNAVRGELGRDGYMRMRQTNRDAADGEFPMGTADVAIGGIEAPDARRGSSQLFGLEGQEITFMTDNGGYRREQWSIVEEVGPEQLREEGFREVLMEEDPPYAEIHFDDEVCKTLFIYLFIYLFICFYIYFSSFKVPKMKQNTFVTKRCTILLIPSF